MRQIVSILLSVLLAVALLPVQPAAADHINITGFVTDGVTGQPLEGVCITVGPPIRCFTHTDANGFYAVDLAALAWRHGSQVDMYFLKQPTYQTAYSEIFTVNDPVRFNQTLLPTGQLHCPPAATNDPTQTVYLPNITKTLGGPAGWQTPFIVQNTGTGTATLEVTFNRFSTGKCAFRRTVSALRPGTSFADVPNNDPQLPGDTQFSVVVRSYGSEIVSVVNQHAGSGDRAEALSYVGVSEGARSVFLPNITRRFFGYVTPFIIQNLGTREAVVTSRFQSTVEGVPDVSVERTVEPGGSRFVDPNSEPGVLDGHQYAVTVTTESQPISVVVNTHNDAPTVAAPVAYSTNGITAGGDTVYGPYAAKNAQGIGRLTTVVVQNVSTVSLTPRLTFTQLGGAGVDTTIRGESIDPGESWAFDPRYTDGDTTEPLCGPGASTGCLPDGEYSFVAESGTDDADIAVAVNVISGATAMGYTAVTEPAAKLYLPNVTRTLGGTTGWTTPILLQSVTATGATLQWYRFSDGALVHTQNVTLEAGVGLRIDPRTVGQLGDNSQYSVVLTASGAGTVAAIVEEIASGGDNAMIYEGFAAE